MKKTVGFLMFSLVLGTFASCRKKMYTCEHGILYQPVSVVFKGFRSSDLAKVVVNKYQPNGQFSQLISADTFDYSSASFSGDTAYLNMGDPEVKIGFISLSSGSDYTFTVLATNDIYRITNIRYGDLSKAWMQGRECPGGLNQSEYAPELFDLNGKPAAPFQMSSNGYVVCFSH